MNPRLLPLLLCVMALPVFADEAVPTPATAGTTSVPLRAANLDDVEKVLPASSRDARQLTRGTVVMAVAYTRKLDKDNPDWNPKNPQWDGVYRQVYADINHDAQTAVGAHSATFNHQFAAAVARQVSERDLQAVLAYYRTDEGLRYRQFEDALDTMVADAMIHALTLVQLGTPPSTDDLNKPVAADRATSRRQLLALSEGYRIIQAKLGANHESPEDDTVNEKTLDMFFKLTNLAGADGLDRLGEQYHGDLDHFASFSHSAPANALYAGLATATSEMLPALGELQQALDQAVEEHMGSWRALYAKTRAKP